MVKMKVLIVGDSGHGKTSLFGTLANAGYKVGLIHVDGNYEILKDPQITKPECLENLSIQPFDTEDADSWEKIRALLKDWPKWGPVASWDDGYVLGIDSVSLCSRAALTYVLKKSKLSIDEFLGAKSLGREGLSEIYGGLAQATFGLISACVSPKLKCHFVGTAHFRMLQGDAKKYLAFEGSKLSTEIPKRFGNVWELKIKPDQSRVILTRPDNLFGRKCSAPSLIDPQEKADLAEIFQKVRG